MSFSLQSKKCLGSLLGCNLLLCKKLFGMPFGAFLSQCMTGAIGLFKFSFRIFESFYVILVVRIAEVYPLQSSSIVEFRFLLRAILFLSIVSGFTHFCPNFWPYMTWSGSCLNLCQSLPQTTNIFVVLFYFSSVNFVNPLQESDRCLLGLGHPSNRQ